MKKIKFNQKELNEMVNNPKKGKKKLSEVLDSKKEIDDILSLMKTFKK